MRRLVASLLLAATVATVATVAACGGDPAPAAPTPSPAAFLRLDIVRGGNSLELVLDRPGDTAQLQAIASFDDGSRTDVSADAAWAVVDPSVLRVVRGLVTGVADGGTIVTATYRGYSTVTSVRVGIPPSQRTYPVAGVVRDAETGTPIVGAEVRVGSGEFASVRAVTDDNGFFSLGDVAGRVLFAVARFGFADTVVDLPHASEGSHIGVSLTPNPGAYIERTVAGTLAPPPDGFDESRTTVHVATRSGGVFDAVARPSTCGPNQAVRLFADSAGRRFISEEAAACAARLRFVVPAADVELTIVGIGVRDWTLTYREPR